MLAADRRMLELPWRLSIFTYFYISIFTCFSEISCNFISDVIIYDFENGRVEEKFVDVESFS
jgi:hypothetical protein